MMAPPEIAQPGDIDRTITALCQHYEAMGDFMVRTLPKSRNSRD